MGNTTKKVKLMSHRLYQRKADHEKLGLFVWLVGWFLNVLVNYKVISRTGPKTERLTILRAATHETELGDHDFYLSRSHEKLGHSIIDKREKQFFASPEQFQFLS